MNREITRKWKEDKERGYTILDLDCGTVRNFESREYTKGEVEQILLDWDKTSHVKIYTD